MQAKLSIRKIAFAGVVAALYAGLTFAIIPLAYTPVQIRISEVLCILPFFFPTAVPGLFVGCIIANLLSPYGMLDVVAGSLASLIAATCTMLIGKYSRNRESGLVKAFACFPPVFFNAVIIGALIAFYMVGFSEFEVFLIAFATNGMWVGIGQILVLYILGLPLMIYLPKMKIFDKLNNLYSGGEA